MYRKLILLSLLGITLLMPAAVRIKVAGEISPGLFKFLERAVADATNAAPSRIIFEINTFGGRVDATYEIVELISDIKVPTIGLVKEKAISAGSLIALSCDRLYMMHNTTIGDCAPIIMTSDGYKMLGEKAQSPLRAKFRSLAERNGYPVLLSESFVSIDMEVIEITWAGGKKEIIDGTGYADLTDAQKKKIINKKTLVPKGELLTMSDTEAAALGFSQASVGGIADILAEDEQLVEFTISAPEKTVIFLNRWAAVLILIGLAGVYLEIKTPGFGIFGITAIAAFSILFLSNYVVEMASYIELIMLVGAIILIGIEIFVTPGFGIFGISGILLLFISLILMMQDFVIPQNPWDFGILKQSVTKVMLGFLLSIPAFLLGLQLIKKIGPRFSIILTSTTGTAATEPDADAEMLHDVHVGDEGEVYSTLRPSGHILVRDQRLDAVTTGEWIEKGSRIRVTRIAGNNIYVEEIK